MRRRIGSALAVFVVSILAAPAMRSAPPGGGACRPVGYTLYCKHTCVYGERVGGVCESKGEEPEGSYCVEAEGVKPWNSCHGGDADECCTTLPVL